MAVYEGSVASLVIFSGLPGTGKSTLAEHAARWLNAPLFAKDELEATLWRAGIDRAANAGWAAYELLTTLARVQLRLGHSVVLDSVAVSEGIRGQWRALAVEHGARLRVVETHCSDRTVHQARLAVRQRGISGWPELTWAEVEDVAARYQPWSDEDERLVLDAMQPLAANLRVLRAYLLPER